MFFFLRKIAKLLRGKATPFQIITGCVLGAMLGFMPGFAQAAGLIVGLTLALILINANLFLAGLVGLAAKLLSLLLLPVSFHVGHFLLDGPTTGFFRALVNAPVFALFGFESYVATGGLVVGGLIGLAAGWAITRAITAFRRKMVDAGQNSARYQALKSKPWMRFVTFVLAGGGMKNPDYAALLQKKTGNPIRPLGVVLVVLCLVLGVIMYQFFASQIITTYLRAGLEEANGATVDLASANLDLKAGRMTLTGLAAADPNALGTDLFRADLIEADLSGASLLRKRLQLDRVVVTGATSGEKRRVPGRRTRSYSVAEAAPAAGAKGLAYYLQNAKVWQERLAQAKQWLDKLSGPPAGKPGTAAAPADESFETRLRRLAAAQGYASLKDTRLIEGAPTLLVSEIQANKVTVAQLPGEILNLTARNLSTQPGLAAGAPEIDLTSASGKLAFNARFAGVTATGGDNTLAFHYRGVPVDQVMATLKLTGGTTLSGGTIDLSAHGRYQAGDGTIDLPLETTLHDTTLTLNGRSTKLSGFTLPIGLSGPLDNPRINVDAKSLGNLALKAGTDALKDKAVEKLKGQAGGIFDSLLGGKK